MNIPFYYVPSWTCKDVNPPIQDLWRSIHKYKDDCATAIASVTASHDIAKKTEWFVFPHNEQPHGSHPLLSNIMEQRLTVIAELLELDGFVLENLLKPIKVTLGIAEHEHHSLCCSITKDNAKSDVSSYDSAMHIITHITRDWTTLGKSIRVSLYNWCIEKISMYRNHGDKILVPGAGFGRLTWDLFRHGYNVEANEISIVMATAAFHILHGKVSGKLHPFAMDYLMNEVMSSDRYQSVEFPDVDTHHLIANGLSLSYTIGDFVEIYSATNYMNQYDSIVTCFFIDTASNIYEYIITIRNALKNGGSWVNVGPLQWHMNAKLHPSGDELKSLIQTMGFDVMEWSVDDEAINYRYDDKDERTRHTKYEGYKPIRFVARYKSDAMYQTMYDAQQMILNIRHSITLSPNRRNNHYYDFPSYDHDSISHVTITELS